MRCCPDPVPDREDPHQNCEEAGFDRNPREAESDRLVKHAQKANSTA